MLKSLEEHLYLKRMDLFVTFKGLSIEDIQLSHFNIQRGIAWQCETVTFIDNDGRTKRLKDRRGVIDNLQVDFSGKDKVDNG